MLTETESSPGMTECFHPLCSCFMVNVTALYCEFTLGTVALLQFTSEKKQVRQKQSLFLWNLVSWVAKLDMTLIQTTMAISIYSHVQIIFNFLGLADS